QGELIRARDGNVPSHSVYIPAIVTVARLVVCRYDSVDISLDDGQASAAAFDEVPCIRFRKSLATELINDADPKIKTLHDENLNKERTVLVVNGRHLLDILGQVKLNQPGNSESWPWSN